MQPSLAISYKYSSWKVDSMRLTILAGGGTLGILDTKQKSVVKILMQKNT